MCTSTAQAVDLGFVTGAKQGLRSCNLLTDIHAHKQSEEKLRRSEADLLEEEDGMSIRLQPWGKPGIREVRIGPTRRRQSS
jgi:hypothetical protein